MGRKRNASADNLTSDFVKTNGHSSETKKGKLVEDGDEAESETALSSRRISKRSAERMIRLSEKNDLVVPKMEPTVENERTAIGLTTGHDDPRPNRRLIDFIFHDEDRKPQPLEMLEVTNLFITGVILPLESSSDLNKNKGVRCEGFGRIESWDISGYDDGTPTIWMSTEIGDYDCGNPATSYKKIYGLLYEKARVCIETYKILSKSFGGNPDVTFDELIASLVSSMSGSENFLRSASIKEFILSRGEFIYDQLIGLDSTSNKEDHKFLDLPVLITLRNEGKKRRASAPQIVDPLYRAPYTCSIMRAAPIERPKNRRSRNKKKSTGQATSNKCYIKINEDEIAADYPLPVHYKPNDDETDEYIIFDNDMDVISLNGQPKNTLHNWSLYNSDSRLVSLELLPMKPCDVDVAIFGSGIVKNDNDSSFCFDADNQSSSASSEALVMGGIPIYLGTIKKWMINVTDSIVCISLKTEKAWYRLGKPSEQYAPWYKPVIKTARLAADIITLLKEQTHVAHLSFEEIVKRVAEYEENYPAFISENHALVERYMVVHGQILLQQFSKDPYDTIRNCSFVTDLYNRMLARHHSKWIVKKKALIGTGKNLNPIANMVPIARMKLMRATTTKLIDRIWREFYLKFSLEESKQRVASYLKKEEDFEEEMELKVFDEKTSKIYGSSGNRTLKYSYQDNKCVREPIPKIGASETFCKQANVFGYTIGVGACVLVETVKSEDLPSIYFVEYIFEINGGKKIAHGRLMLRGSQTILGNAANERELFLTHNCFDFELEDIKQSIQVEIRQVQWGYQHRNANAVNDKIDRENAAERKRKGLPLEYYCKSLYQPDKGSFSCIPNNSMGNGNGTCDACNTKEAKKDKKHLKVNSSGSCFIYDGAEYTAEDFFYVAPQYFAEDRKENVTLRSSSNVGLKPYVICQLLEIKISKVSQKYDLESVKILARRFFRPEDISAEKAYHSDIREVYLSEEQYLLNVAAIQGKCYVRRKHDISSLDYPAIYDHIFFCEHLYDANSGAIKQLPGNIRLHSVFDESMFRKKEKGIDGDHDEAVNQKGESLTKRLATLDIFAGCGGLSEGLEQSGVAQTKWAIECEEPAGEAFNLNHPGASVFINNCNVILRAIMSACGDDDDCISAPEACEEARKLDEKVINDFPKPGQVDFIIGGPPCQDFSGINGFSEIAWSKVQCEMILTFLSFADYFRPKYVVLENLGNFVSFNKGQTFRLSLASLLEMGYQVKFGILEAGAFGVSQSRKHAFIWAASPEEMLPDWPEPMHVFAGPELNVTLNTNTQFAAVRSTATGAPFRSITVRDTIGDLPAVGNGASLAIMEYKNEPVSWFHKMIRGDMMAITDHISKEMNELNLIRCQIIPKRPDADWRDLPNDKIKLSTGQTVDMVPWYLPTERHNQWRGLFGRLDWEGNFPSSITDPQSMGKIGMCFHPDQDRIVTVRECARSLSFPDNYKFAGNIQDKHRQIDGAVPPPLAFALGRKLKEAVDKKGSV
ncbi:unnamed protein product [Amaranthus hypochondriacus]